MSDNDGNTRTCGYVYVLSAVGTSRVKIGRTDGAIADRIAKLQTGNPFTIQERAHIETSYPSRVEAYLHALLAASRGETGEWFEVADDEFGPAFAEARHLSDHLEANADALAALGSAQVEDREEPANTADRVLHLRLLELYARRRRVEVEIEMIEDELKLRVGTAASLDAIATWRAVESTRLDQGRLRTERPDLFAEYCDVARARRFVISRNIGSDRQE